MNGKKLFLPENHMICPEEMHFLFSTGEVMQLDPKTDRLLLESIGRYASGTKKKAVLGRLGLDELVPEDPRYVSDGLFDEAYWILDEQIRTCTEMADGTLLHGAAFVSRTMAATFAFCRMTGYRFPAPASDVFSHRDYSCGRMEWMTRTDVEVFCQEMKERQGPFAREAEQVLRALAPKQGQMEEAVFRGAELL